MHGVAPFPYQTLKKVSRTDVTLLRGCARRLPIAKLDALQQAASAMLGAQVVVAPDAVEACNAGAIARLLTDPITAAIIEREPSPTVRPIAVEVSARLGLCLIDRALGGEGGAAVAEPMGAPLCDAERGVLAYLFGRLLAAASESPWRLRAIVTSPAALAYALGNGDGVGTVWSLAIRVGSDRGIARVWMPEVSGPTSHWVDTSKSLGWLPVTLAVHIGVATLSGAQLSTLRPGDVLVPDEMWARPGGNGLEGEARAAVAHARRARWRCALHGSELVVRSIDRSEEMPTRQARTQTTDPQDSTTAVDVLGDAPVEIAVEVARFELPLEELCALRPGEVLATGRALGSEVTLRAGGRAIAAGELVNVDGDIGVRLVRILHAS